MKLPRLAKLQRPARAGITALFLLALFGIVGSTGGLSPDDYVSRGLVDEVRYRVWGREMRFTLACPIAPKLRYAVARGEDRPEVVGFVEARLPGCKVLDNDGTEASR